MTVWILRRKTGAALPTTRDQTACRPSEQIWLEYFTLRSASSLASGLVLELARNRRELLIPPATWIVNVIHDLAVRLSFPRKAATAEWAR